jgi:hypothetical protein
MSDRNHSLVSDLQVLSNSSTSSALSTNPVQTTRPRPPEQCLRSENDRDQNSREDCAYHDVEECSPMKRPRDKDEGTSNRILASSSSLSSSHKRIRVVDQHFHLSTDDAQSSSSSSSEEYLPPVGTGYPIQPRKKERTKSSQALPIESRRSGNKSRPQSFQKKTSLHRDRTHAVTVSVPPMSTLECKLSGLPDLERGTDLGAFDTQCPSELIAQDGETRPPQKPSALKRQPKPRTKWINAGKPGRSSSAESSILAFNLSFVEEVNLPPNHSDIRDHSPPATFLKEEPERQRKEICLEMASSRVRHSKLAPALPHSNTASHFVEASGTASPTMAVPRYRSPATTPEHSDAELAGTDQVKSSLVAYPRDLHQAPEESYGDSVSVSASSDVETLSFALDTHAPASCGTYAKENSDDRKLQNYHASCLGDVQTNVSDLYLEYFGLGRFRGVPVDGGLFALSKSSIPWLRLLHKNSTNIFFKVARLSNFVHDVIGEGWDSEDVLREVDYVQRGKPYTDMASSKELQRIRSELKKRLLARSSNTGLLDNDGGKERISPTELSFAAPAPFENSNATQGCQHVIQKPDCPGSSSADSTTEMPRRSGRSTRPIQGFAPTLWTTSDSSDESVNPVVESIEKYRPNWIRNTKPKLTDLYLEWYGLGEFEGATGGGVAAILAKSPKWQCCLDKIGRDRFGRVRKLTRCMDAFMRRTSDLDQRSAILNRFDELQEGQSFITLSTTVKFQRLLRAMETEFGDLCEEDLALFKGRYRSHESAELCGIDLEESASLPVPSWKGNVRKLKFSRVFNEWFGLEKFTGKPVEGGFQALQAEDPNWDIKTLKTREGRNRYVRIRRVLQRIQGVIEEFSDQQRTLREFDRAQEKRSVLTDNIDEITERVKTAFLLPETHESQMNARDESAFDGLAEKKRLRLMQKYKAAEEHIKPAIQLDPSSVTFNVNSSPYYIEETSFLSSGEISPLSPPPPLQDPPFPSKVKWQFCESSRVYHANFRGLAVSQLTVEDLTFFGYLLERDDIAFVSEGLLEGLNPHEWRCSHLKSIYGDFRFHSFRKFETIEADGNTLYKEHDKTLSLTLRDFISYIEMWEDHQKRKSELSDIDTIDWRFDYEGRDKDGNAINEILDVRKDIVYLIDVDLGEKFRGLTKNFQDNFKMPKILPGGGLCLMRAVTESARPFMGPNLYVKVFLPILVFFSLSYCCFSFQVYGYSWRIHCTPPGR